MLDPRRNRIDFGEQLHPPSIDHDLEFAVGTTYSLDLETLLGLPAAIVYSRLLDSDPEQDKLDHLAAISQAADKIRVYCQQDKRKVPKKYHSLMSFCEKMVVPVRLEEWNKSFHAKFWLLRFQAPDLPAHYRLIITSRNLTQSQDWDIAFVTEGSVGDKDTRRNKPLMDFLFFLQSQKQGEIPQEFITDLARTEFTVPDQFEALAFHPMGFSLGETNYKNPLQSRKWDELLVVSPFVDNTTVANLGALCSDRMDLLSRREELDTLRPDVVEESGGVYLWQFSRDFEAAGMLADLQDDSETESQAQDIHAKLFIGKKQNTYHWFLGSANSTTAALKKNIEFLIELKSQNAAQSPAKMLKSLTETGKGHTALFDPYELPELTVEEVTEKSGVLRKLIYELTGVRFTGEAVPRTTEHGVLYDLRISVDLAGIEAPAEAQITCRPIAEGAEHYAELKPGVHNEISKFCGYSLQQLSPYLAISVRLQDDAKACLVEMDIDLPEGRWSAIMRTLIDSKEKFIAYIGFLLGESDQNLELDSVAVREQQDSTRASQKAIELPPILESLMIAASRRPIKLAAVAKMVESFANVEQTESNTVIPEGFLRLWELFAKYQE